MITDDIKNKITRLLNDGYQSIPTNDLEHGINGIVLFKGNDEVFLEWPIFEKPLVKEESIVNIKEFFDFINQPDIVKYDNPKQLLLGAVQFFPQEGKSIVKYLKITALKTSNSDIPKKIMDRRKELEENKISFRPEIPRRIQLDQFVPAEKAIWDAVQLVEDMGADVRLTKAIILLGQAREQVADFVDGITKE